MKQVLIILGIGLVLGILGWTGYFLYSKDQEKPVVYETEQPFYTDIINKTVATGSVVPRKEIEIKPQVSGLIRKLFVEPGDQVKKGDLIADIPEGAMGATYHASIPGRVTAVNDNIEIERVS